MSELLTAEISIRTVRAIGSILLHDEVALVPSFDLSAQRDSRLTQAESGVSVMASKCVCLVSGCYAVEAFDGQPAGILHHATFPG